MIFFGFINTVMYSGLPRKAKKYGLQEHGTARISGQDDLDAALVHGPTPVEISRVGEKRAVLALFSVVGQISLPMPQGSAGANAYLLDLTARFTSATGN